MDFIERFLDISPDGGSGTTEAVYIAVFVAVVVVFILRRRVFDMLRHRFNIVRNRNYSG